MNSTANDGKTFAPSQKLETNSTREIGRQAFDAFAKAVETGDSEHLVELMAEDVRFFVPMPFEEWRGEQRGRERVRELIEFERKVLQLQIKFELFGIAATSNLAAVEFRVAGSNKGGAYQNHLAIFFHIENGKISRFAEYVGDVDPKMVAAVNQKTQ